jgi:hypothetical protein
MTPRLFGALISLALLALYGYAVAYAVSAASCLSGAGAATCGGYSADLNTGVVLVLTLIGGLVSALVVAELAITPPKTPVTGRLFAPDDPANDRIIATWVTAAYLLGWLVTGATLVIVCLINHPDVVPQATSAAKTWLGLAVVAGYSYLGVNPPRT